MSRQTLLLVLTVFVVLCYTSSVSATALTYTVAAHERACFYAHSDHVGRKVGFYFAVQSGGSFDIDYMVTDPTHNIVVSGEKERQGDFVFSAEHVGEYSFCFSNGMSTFAEKIVDFDITLENESLPSAQLLKSGSTAQTDTSFMEETIYRISSHLNNFSRNQKFYRTRENRNNDTVMSTEKRVFWFAVIESFLMIGMSVMQVFIVKTFFKGPRGRV
ncbi:emp24/gp25L/p24 family/GOLD-domain-containing protein [Paraphysoderma sedebokerense]|nr:emp24/gp25L/p24 family/GOLD-domain-containing protein [Paraphysoderma sedebokerense]